MTQQPDILRDGTKILEALAEYKEADDDEDSKGHYSLNGTELSALTGLSPSRVNDAVELLQLNQYIDWVRTFGTAPYSFRSVELTPQGRYEYQRLMLSKPTSDSGLSRTEGPQLARRPVAAGSPFGFTDLDWEHVDRERRRADRLTVVFGYQFSSQHYDQDQLRPSVQSQFEAAVAAYNAELASLPVTLNFRCLAAGYGEHLFNEIARDIISADIAVFETSDQNPNVMIELGVALTWGIRVLPIKVEGTSSPPSDISGQTWADYRDHGAEFVDPDHASKLVAMVRRAVQRKGRDSSPVTTKDSFNTTVEATRAAPATPWPVRAGGPQFRMSPGLDQSRLLCDFQISNSSPAPGGLEARWVGAGTNMDWTKPMPVPVSSGKAQAKYRMKPVAMAPKPPADEVAFEVRFYLDDGQHGGRWTWPVRQHEKGHWRIEAHLGSGLYQPNTDDTW